MSRVIIPHAARRAVLLAATGAALFLTACGGGGGLFSGSSSKLSIASSVENSILQPAFSTAVYTATDRTGADIYLTDLPPEAFAAADGQPAILRGGYAGTILHLRVFLIPKAGKTPIDYNATNTTITAVVLTGDAHGQYGGGGFLLPSGKPLDNRFGGAIRQGTVQFVAGTPGFADRIGFGELSGNVSAALDDDTAAVIAGVMARLAAERTVTAPAPTPAK